MGAGQAPPACLPSPAALLWHFPSPGLLPSPSHWVPCSYLAPALRSQNDLLKASVRPCHSSPQNVHCISNKIQLCKPMGSDPSSHLPYLIPLFLTPLHSSYPSLLFIPCPSLGIIFCVTGFIATVCICIGQILLDISALVKCFLLGEAFPNHPFWSSQPFPLIGLFKNVCL